MEEQIKKENMMDNILEHVKNAGDVIQKKYLEEAGNDLIVLDKMIDHYQEDPEDVLKKWLKAFEDLDDKDYLTGSGKANLLKLRQMKELPDLAKSDITSSSIDLTSEDLTGPGFEYAKDKFNNGIS